MASGNSSSGVQLGAMQKLAQLAIQGDYDQVRHLVTAHLVKAVDEGGRTVLILAADADWTPQPFSKCIEYFLHLDADAKAADLAGNTAAHVAAGRNNVQMLALLPFEAKWLANKEGVTPLMEAVQKRRWQCAKHLLHLFRQFRYHRQKSQLLETKNRQGQTALDIAKSSGQTDLVRVIELETRLVVSGEEEKPGTWGISGLLASEVAAEEELLRLARAGDLAGLRRLATPVSCDLPGADGWTPLMSSARWAEYGSDEAVQLLLNLGADATCASVHGRSCLHLAAERGRAGTAAHLLDAGASANARDADDRTPLMYAAWLAPPATAAACGRALISAGADWSLRHSGSETALDEARIMRRSDLAALLYGYNGKSFFDEPLELTESAKTKLAQLKQNEVEQQRNRKKGERRKQDGEKRRRREEEKPSSHQYSQPYLEKWDKVRLLGRGAFGEVHEVLTDTGVRCAAKIIKLQIQLGDKPDLPEVRDKMDKFVRGERILCELRHDNIVRFLHITEMDKNFKIVLFMELLNGESLEQMVNKKPADEVTIRHFSIQICSALHYLHSQQPSVIHRDIKSSNIMVIDSRQIKLIDFGLAIKLSATNATHLTGTSSLPKGTANFMAPELFGTEDPEKILYSRESDIWAFGCTVYHMSTGNVPHSGCDMFAICLRLQQHGAPQLPDQCSALLRNFYPSCVAKERRGRKSADELLKHEFLRLPNA